MKAVLVLATAPDPKTGRKLARMLVRQKLAACVSCRDGFESTYHWRGKIEVTQETLLLIKTSAARYKALERAIRKYHPYEVPEMLVFGASGGSSDYLNWMAESLR